MNCRLLIEQNVDDFSKIPTFNKKGVYQIDLKRYNEMSGTEIRILLCRISKIVKTYGRSCKKINIIFDAIIFRDKLTYIMLECILHALIVEYGVNASVLGNVGSVKLETCGLYQSFLRQSQCNYYSVEQFEQHFKWDLTYDHFRRVYNGKTPDDSMDLCLLMTDIKSFLKVFSLENSYINTTAEVITELVDNAREHAEADCLIDIDVSEEIIRGDKKYHCINISIVNFSEICLWDRIMKKFEQRKFGTDSARYQKVLWAYENHKASFSDDYSVQDFYNIVAFQDSISGRNYETETGGTGLTELIKILEQSSEDHYCYMLSGDKGLEFNLDYLAYNEDHWIGFNKQNDFICDRPAREVILRTDTYIPGTAYNISLIARKES